MLVDGRRNYSSSNQSSVDDYHTAFDSQPISFSEYLEEQCDKFLKAVARNLDLFHSLHTRLPLEIMKLLDKHRYCLSGYTNAEGDETTPFLHDVERPANRNGSVIVLVTMSLINLIVLLFNLNLLKLPSNYVSNAGMESYSPAREKATYILKNEHATDHSKFSAFSGPPNVNNTKAWEDLIWPTFFAVTADDILEAEDTVDDSVELAGGGYIAALGVYHEIHCLRQLRLFLYSNVYYPNLTQANIGYLQKHLDHCLETIRISVMCSADLSLYTFRWGEVDDDRPWPKSSSSRKCIHWDGLHSWARDRMVPLNPILLRTTGEAEKIHMRS